MFPFLPYYQAINQIAGIIKKKKNAPVVANPVIANNSTSPAIDFPKTQAVANQTNPAPTPQYPNLAYQGPTQFRLDDNVTNENMARPATPTTAYNYRDSIQSQVDEYNNQIRELQDRISGANIPSEAESQALANLRASIQGEKQGLFDISQKVIPQSFITGQQKALREQALLQQDVLQDTYDTLSGARKANVDALQTMYDNMVKQQGVNMSMEELKMKASEIERQAQKIDTQVVQLDNGNALLIDKNTGEIIKNFGGAKPSGSSGIMGMGGSSNGIGGLAEIAQQLTVGMTKDQVTNFKATLDMFAGNPTKMKDYLFKTLITTKNLPAGEGNKVYNRFLMYKALDGLDKSLQEYYSSGGETNILSGSGQGVLEKLGAVGDPKLYSAGKKIANFVDEIARYRTGAALTESEEKFYRNMSPSIMRGKKANEAGIAGLKASLEDYINAGLGLGFGSEGLTAFLDTEGGIYSPQQEEYTQVNEDDPLGIF